MFVVPFRDQKERDHQVGGVVEHLREGGLVLYPTETVYGLGGLVTPESIGKLTHVKGRAEDSPFLLLVREPEQVPGLEWTECARRLADAFWPGPLTLILDAPAGSLPPGAQGADGGVALRRSPHPAVVRLLEAMDGPITSTSANRAGAPPARTAEEALALLKRIDERDDVWLLNGGDAPGGPPSTIVDCRREPARLVRRGAVEADALRDVVGDLEGGG